MGSSPTANTFFLRYIFLYIFHCDSCMRCGRDDEASSCRRRGASRSLWKGMGDMGCRDSVEVTSGGVLMGHSLQTVLCRHTSVLIPNKVYRLRSSRYRLDPARHRPERDQDPRSMDAECMRENLGDPAVALMSLSLPAAIARLVLVFSATTGCHVCLTSPQPPPSGSEQKPYNSSTLLEIILTSWWSVIVAKVRI